MKSCINKHKTAVQLFNMMLRDTIEPILRSYKFCRRGNALYKYTENYCGIIDFQKITRKEANGLTFTVNVGVVSYVLLGFMGQLSEDRKLEIWDAQWNMRLGQLMPEKKDVWWDITGDIDIKVFENSLVQNIVNLAIPEINKYMNDAQLRDLWLSGKAPSLTEFQRIIYLLYFLKTIGPLDLLDKYVDALNQITLGKPTYLTAQIFLSKLSEV